MKMKIIYVLALLICGPTFQEIVIYVCIWMSFL